MEPADETALRIIAELARHGLAVVDAAAQLVILGVDAALAQQTCTDLLAGNLSQTSALVQLGFNP